MVMITLPWHSTLPYLGDLGDLYKRGSASSALPLSFLGRLNEAYGSLIRILSQHSLVLYVLDLTQ